MKLRELLKKKVQFLSLLKLKCDETISAIKDNKKISIVDKLQLLNVDCDVAINLPDDKEADATIKDLIKRCEDLGFEFFKPLHLIVTICSSLDATALKGHRPIVDLLSDILTLQAEYEKIYQSEAIEFLYTKLFLDFSSRLQKLSREIARLPFKQIEDYKNLYKPKDLSVNTKSSIDTPTNENKPGTQVQSKFNFSIFSRNSDEKNDRKIDKKAVSKIKMNDDEFNSSFAVVELVSACEEYKKYNIKKIKDYPTKKERVTKKNEMLDELIGKLETKRKKSHEKIDLFIQYFVNHRSELMKPTKTIGLSAGEKFVKNIDLILKPFLEVKKALKR